MHEVSKIGQVKIMESLRGQGKGFRYALDVMRSHQRVSNQASGVT